MVPLWLGQELGGSSQECGTSVAENRVRREFTRIWHLCGWEQSKEGVYKNMVPLWLGTELGVTFQEYGTSVAGNRARREFTRLWYLCGWEQG
jgi:hypothetical protein